MKLSTISFFSASSRKSHSKTRYNLHILIPPILFLLSNFPRQRNVLIFGLPLPLRSCRFSQLLKIYNMKDYFLSLQRLFILFYATSLNHIRHVWRSRFSCVISISNCTKQFITTPWPTQKNEVQKIMIYTVYFILFDNHYFKYLSQYSLSMNWHSIEFIP